MAVKLGNGNWAVKEDKLLAYNDNSGLFFNKEFDFSRGTSATYVAKDGLIKTAGIQPNIVNNGDFSELGSELVTNGNFDTDSSWSKTNATISDGKATITVVGGAYSLIAQSFTYQSGKIYKLTAQVQGTNGKACTFFDNGSNIGGLGSSNGVINFDGNLQDVNITFTANTNSNQLLIVRNGSGDYTFTVDNVSVKQVDPNDYWTLEDCWSFGENKVISDGSGSLPNTDLVQTNLFTSTDVYKITVEIQDYVSGTLQLQNNTTNFPQSNGTHTIYKQASSGASLILRSLSFVGSVTNITVQLIQTDTPRIDFTNDTKGHLLLEPSRTNIITYSEDFSEWTNTRTSTSTDETLSPKGELFSYKLTETNDTGFHGLFKNETVSSGVSHTFSVFLKKGTSSFVQILFGTNNVSGNPYVNFDVNNGVLQNYGATSTKIEEYLNEWYRCSVTITTATTSLSSYVSPIQSITSSRVESFTGDINKYFYLFGAQLEAGSYPTSYIPTTGAASTRNADVCNNSGSAQDFNSEEGVLYAEIAALTNDLSNRFISLTDGTDNNSVTIYYGGVSNRIRSEIKSGAVTQADLSTTAYNIINYNKIAVKYKQNSFSLYVNGTEVATDTSGSTPSGLNDLSFDRANILTFYGKVRNVQVFTEALTDEQLEKLTS